MRIVYHSFEGRYSDSPRALYEHLEAHRPGVHEHVWLTQAGRDHGHPAHVETHPWGAPAAREALESADMLIANSHTDTPWEKPAGTTYLQTWHGTPLKRIHYDGLWAPPGRIDELHEDVVKWDLLLSPNAVSTPRLRGAFRYEGELLESGYPRNDVLTSPGRDAVRERVRAGLGIAPEQRVVLYAPTWRDDAVLPEGGKEFSLGLDPHAVGDALAATGGVLLLRLHYLVSGRLGAVDHPGVREVSFHPDISELYLAADVLVTDYSSVMFDWAVTGKPQVFFTYDLEDYQDRLRGFYFDFAPEAPGPLVRTQGELLAALADLPAVTAAHADAYAAFRERYCQLEDGHACRRVLTHVGLL